MKAAISSFIGLVFVVCASAEPLIEGRVQLDSGDPVANAQVQLFDMTDLEGGPIARATTDATGSFALSLQAFARGSALPQGFALGQNYPNPFNPSTIVPYQLPTATHVRLEVFNLLGQRVATLVDGQRSAGFHTAQWDATDAAGRAVAAGVYIYRLLGGEHAVSRRMVLIDGQAGVPAAVARPPVRSAEAGPAAADRPVYGLTVAGAGLVAYVNPAFRVGVDAADIVLEAHGSRPRMKRAAGGILGDVNNDGQVDASDALYVLLYIEDSSIALPNNGDISLGDLNGDGTVDFADLKLFLRYLADPSDPSLPAGIGQGGGTPPSSVRPPSPSNVRYEWDSSISQYRVSWDPSPGATSYQVYYDDTIGNVTCPGGCDLIGTVSDTSMGHYKRIIGEKHIGYWVRACNDEGCSNLVTAEPADSDDTADPDLNSEGATDSPPHPPANVWVEYGRLQRYKISWDPVPNATFYKVYWDRASLFSPSCPGGCEQIATVEGTLIEDNRWGVSFGYWIKACNSAGCSQLVRAEWMGFLVAATLSGNSVMLRLLEHRFERSSADIREALELSEAVADKVTISRLSRISDTEVKVEFLFDDTADNTVSFLKFIFDAGAIANYDGPALVTRELLSIGADLAVVSFSVSDSSPAAGRSIRLNATVQNEGSGPASSTRLRYYRSTDATITTSDVEVNDEFVFSLESFERSDEWTFQRVPSIPGTYYYGACIEVVLGESDATNNCSPAASVTIK